MNKNKKNILWFNEISIKDVPLVGGKTASLGEMYQKLTKKGIRIPNGFAITAGAYKSFIETTGMDKQITTILKGLNTKDLENLAERGRKVRDAILSVELPKDLEREIINNYKKLGREVSVAVRSSATAEDLPDASFAGQQETFLNIRGGFEVVQAVKKCMASLFTNRAISYRVDKGFDHLAIYLSVAIQEMVRSDKACSGVMFSIDPNSGHKNFVVINGAWGLGEMVVQGKVSPDEFYVFKPSLKNKKLKPIVGRVVGRKERKMIYALEGENPVREVEVPEEERKKYVIRADDILQLARWACIIEDHYKKPMDIEWAKDGITKELFIVQARPETIHASGKSKILREYKLIKEGNLICSGVAVGSLIGQGKARVIKDTTQINQFQKGGVLVTEITDPDWEPIMKIASAIVTNSGGRTSHAAIVSRELGIPCVVGTHEATRLIKAGQEITVSCAQGEQGFVYDGKIPFKIKETDLSKLKKPKSSIMEIVADPAQALEFSLIPNQGVGLAREELIVLNHIKIHPMAILHPEKITDEEIRKKIDEVVAEYRERKRFYIHRLSEGVGRIVAAFWPKPVIVRTSDFKSNEYANLLGGKYFEPKEENPMIGWRGAARYYSKEYVEAFALECQALKRVRERIGLKNMKIMIPFVRTVEEAKKVLQLMAKNGLKRGKDGLEVYMMCEIPSNVILADKFAPLFDGFSIGSNDLTQLTLGLDRDSALVSHLYNERNEAVKRLIAQVIKICHKYKIKIGLCGQAPSDFPEMARFLVDCGIDSFSVTPDTVMRTTADIAKYEQSKKRK